MRSQDPTRPRPAPADLAARYGEIGISAVAAAVRYQRPIPSPSIEPAEEQKQPTDAPA